jgi:murein DD-endopeptidase MepM/ murein hydrolase activator NlpD
VLLAMTPSEEMRRRLAITPFLIALFTSAPELDAQVVVREVPGLTITLDTAGARPGGLLVARIHSTHPLGTTTALLDGRRAPFFPAEQGLRALVGIPVTARAGTATLGIEIRGRRGRRRLSVDFAIAVKAYPQRTPALSEPQLRAVESAATLHDSRRLLALLRTASPTAHWKGPFQPPVQVEARISFGVGEGNPDGPPLNERLDGIHGEYHRGLDYDVPSGTLVQAPAAGTVLATLPLGVGGLTLVLDHGHGLVSILCHLSRIDVREGQWVESRTPLGLSGETGVVERPHLHWGVYVHGIAVDPGLLIQTTF